jgi:hypothetical protein
MLTECQIANKVASRHPDPGKHNLANGLVTLGELDDLSQILVEFRRMARGTRFDEGTCPAFRVGASILLVCGDGGKDLGFESREELSGVEGTADDNESEILWNVC